ASSQRIAVYDLQALFATNFRPLQVLDSQGTLTSQVAFVRNANDELGLWMAEAAPRDADPQQTVVLNLDRGQMSANAAGWKIAAAALPPGWKATFADPPREIQIRQPGGVVRVAEAPRQTIT